MRQDGQPDSQDVDVFEDGGRFATYGELSSIFAVKLSQQPEANDLHVAGLYGASMAE
jgi:hypothetical protein